MLSESLFEDMHLLLGHSKTSASNEIGSFISRLSGIIIKIFLVILIITQELSKHFWLLHKNYERVIFLLQLSYVTNWCFHVTP